MYRLYNMPGTAGMAPHILLREIGVAHELVMLDHAADGHKEPNYLKINPLGRVPTFADGDVVFYEAAAICLYLTQKHPEAGLAPPPGTGDHALFLQWLMFLTNSVQADEMIWFYPERWSPPEAHETVKALTHARLMEMFSLLDRALAGRTWLVGERFSAADAYLFMLSRWTRNMPTKARDLPNLKPYLARIHQRPAVQEMFRIEGLAEPHY